EDRISQLPDPLICHILSHLPTKEAVTTSVLSTRWRSLWLCVPKLKLDSKEIGDFNSFVSLGDRFFDSDRVSCIDKLKLTIDKNGEGVNDTSYITTWIDAAAKRKVQHLRVNFLVRFSYEMPVSLYVFKTLVSVKLFHVTLNDVEFVSFPCLKTMHLDCVCLSKICKDAAFERLVSCCPVLEDLEIVRCTNAPQPLRVQSRSLKMLNIVRGYSSQIDFFHGVVIDAPLLCCLSIHDAKSKSFIVNNLEYNAKLEVCVTFGLEVADQASGISLGRSLISTFLSGISKVGDLTIHEKTFKIIYNYLKSESLPRFGYMSRLCVSLYPSYMKGLPAFLESCPNLKSLVLEELHLEEMPKCLQSSSLEFVDFKFPFWGDVEDMKLVKCFLENCVILKQLTLHLHSYPTKDEILKKLLEVPAKCEQIFIVCQVIFIGLVKIRENM
ncbi:hypothetical protein CARUB_v10028196mg, partial [Capsella rubella]